MWEKFYFCLSCVNSKSYWPATYLPQSGPNLTPYGAWAAFYGHVCWHIVCGDVFLLVNTCNMPATDLPALLNWGNMICFPPLLLTVFFPWSTCALKSAVHDLGILLCSSSTACVKCPLIKTVPFFFCSHRYCSVVTRLLCICLMFHIISLPIFITLISLMTPYAHGPPSSHCTATVDPTGKKWVFVSFIVLNIFILVCFDIYGFPIHLR